MTKLNIIVPVYNTSKYLSRCLDSLINQSCVNELKVLIINDGSTDNSQDIIDEYVKKYPKLFKSFIKQNGGLSDARNYGIQNLDSQYLTFLDSDDWIDCDLYGECLTFIELYNYDYICFNYIEEWGKYQKLIDSTLRVSRSKYFTPAVATNKIFNTQFWQKNDFKFSYGLKYEDLELIPKIIHHSTSRGYLDNTANLLHYDRTNVSSITNLSRDTRSLVIILENLLSFNEKVNDSDLTKYIATTFFFHLILFGGDTRISWQIYKKHKNLFCYNNMLSKFSKKILWVQKLNLDFVLYFLIYILNILKVNPNKI